MLQENNFQINDNIENFYQSLYQRLQLVSDQNQTGTAGENNSTANGTTNGVTNGATNGVTNGTTNGTGNGTTNGTTTGRTVGNNR